MPNSSFAQEDMCPLFNPEHPRLYPIDFTVSPELGCWFLGNDKDFQDEGYKNFLDAIASQGAFELLSVSTRYDIEVTEPRFHDMMKKAAHYAKEKYGVGLLLDLDIRLARRAFEKKHPQALQEKLIYLEKPILEQNTTEIVFQAVPLDDHYTSGSIPYVVRGNRFMKAWSYAKNENGEIIPHSIRDIADHVSIESSSNETVVLKCQPAETEPDAKHHQYVCGVVAFSYLSADVFAPELISFEKEILRQYADIPLVGVCKDEWGFPPDFRGNHWKNEYWYSEAMQKEYSKIHQDRLLVDDCFLMCLPQEGKTNERIDLIDAFNRLCFQKNVEVESEYVRTAKDIFGPNAFPATHPTWWPWPDSREFVKNQLSWWKVPRDKAQTDECTPYFCRTSMAKGTNSIWYNMFYSSNVMEYIPEIWGAVLAAGRVNIHPIYPASSEQQSGYRITPILDTGLREARQIIRLLDLITHSPVDSPVAVVFGHFGTMNWARPEYDQVGTSGIALCNRIAGNGYPVDLIPSSQSDSGLWSMNSRGYLNYGVQEYPVVVFLGETDSDHTDFDEIRKLLNHQTRTKLIEIHLHSSHLDFPQKNGEQINESTDLTSPKAADNIINILRQENVFPQTAWSIARPWQDFPMARPPRCGKARYTDGTLVWIAAENNVSGDKIRLHNERIEDAHTQPVISVEATGMFACRFAEDGTLTAFAAGALQRFEVGDISIDLSDQPTDIAVWKNQDGTWNGVFQSNENKLPPRLKNFPSIQWQYLEK